MRLMVLQTHSSEDVQMLPRKSTPIMMSQSLVSVGLPSFGSCIPATRPRRAWQRLDGSRPSKVVEGLQMVNGRLGHQRLVPSSDHSPFQQLLSEIWSLLLARSLHHSSPKLLFNAGNQIAKQPTSSSTLTNRRKLGKPSLPRKTKIRQVTSAYSHLPQWTLTPGRL